MKIITKETDGVYPYYGEGRFTKSHKASGYIEIEAQPLPDGSFAKYYNADGTIAEIYEAELLLSAAKTAKLAEIKAEKKRRQLAPVEVRGILWYGGREAGQKYNEAFDLAKKMGLDRGNFLSVDAGMVEVDEDFANEVIIAVASQVYRCWAKEQGYIAAIEDAYTIEEVEAIQWNEM